MVSSHSKESIGNTTATQNVFYKYHCVVSMHKRAHVEEDSVGSTTATQSVLHIGNCGVSLYSRVYNVYRQLYGNILYALAIRVTAMGEEM